MKKNKIKIVVILLITLLLIITLTNRTLAIDPSFYNPGSSSEASNADKLKDMANIVIGTIQIIGNIISVIALAIIGIKYMIGSVDERAEYKKTLRPYLIGAVMVFGITNILGIVVKIAENL